MWEPAHLYAVSHPSGMPRVHKQIVHEFARLMLVIGAGVVHMLLQYLCMLHFVLPAAMDLLPWHSLI